MVIRAVVPEMLRGKTTLIVAGSGGVGKTTVAAALGLAAAAEPGKRVLVLTVDPARRLATALGLTHSDGSARMVDSGSGGELWAEMLDASREWDRLIAAHAPDEATREAVLANPLYRNVTRRFIHSHEYAAMERLHDLQSSGEWDLIVLDTPPSRHALDLLDAPARMTDFFGGRLLRWLTSPASSRLAMAASKPFRMVADRVLGGPFLTDLADFFMLMKTMEKGFIERAAEVERSLSDETTGFVVVTTPERGPVGEVGTLVLDLKRRRCDVELIIVNRAIPDFGGANGRSDSAGTGLDPAEMAGLAKLMPTTDPAEISTVLEVMGSTRRQMMHSAEVESRILDGLPGNIPAVRVPLLEADPCDLAGMGTMAAILIESAPVVA